MSPNLLALLTHRHPVFPYAAHVLDAALDVVNSGVHLCLRRRPEDDRLVRDAGSEGPLHVRLGLHLFPRVCFPPYIKYKRQERYGDTRRGDRGGELGSKGGRGGVEYVKRVP